MTTVVGLDLSLTSTGVAIVDNTGPDLRIQLHRVRSAGREDATLDQRRTRLREITDEITRQIHAALFDDPDLVVIEGPSYNQHAQRGQHDRSGLWWTVVAGLSNYGPLAEVPPTLRAKYATGRGNAHKDAVLAATVHRYPVEITGNDTADALILAAMGARHLGQPIEPGPLPLTHESAVHAVHWPA